MMTAAEPAGDLATPDLQPPHGARTAEVVWTAVVAHELRQPLTAMAGYAQLMQRRRTYDAHTLERILEAAQRLGHIVDDLLDVSNLVAGQFALRAAHVDLVAIVAGCVAQAQALGEHRTLRLETPGRPLVGWWDADRIAQVLTNLLLNAIKYTPDGTEVTCRVADAGAEARVAVVDHGPGIPTSDLPHLFEPFYRAASAVESDAPGFGLGLYLSKALVEAHGGRMWVDSDVGHGSTFSFALPYEAAVAQAAEGPPHRSGSPDRHIVGGTRT
jgi:signal transduction histidine kinase